MLVTIITRSPSKFILFFCFFLAVKASVQVKTEDIVNLEFVQTGFKATVTTSHKMGLTFQSSQHSQEFNVTEGTHQFCIKAPAHYQVIPKSCYKFQKDSFSFDTNNPQPVELVATQVFVKGHIETSRSASPKDFQITVKTEADHVLPCNGFLG